MKQMLPRPAVSLDIPDDASDFSGLRPRKRLPQFSLSTLLLITACVAVWGSNWLNTRQIKKLEWRTTNMRSLARELVIKDRSHIAVVHKDPFFYDEQVWHVYLPDDSFGLHLVTRGIPPTLTNVTNKSAGPLSTAPLPAGRHAIELKSELKDNQWHIQVLVDDEPVIAVREPKEWHANRGSSGGGHFSTQADLPTDHPIVLFDRVFMIPNDSFSSTYPTQPSNGIALWIDQLPSSPQEKR